MFTQIMQINKEIDDIDDKNNIDRYRDRERQRQIEIEIESDIGCFRQEGKFGH